MTIRMSGALAGLLVTLIGWPAVAANPAPAAACFPACRAGYVCNAGQCVSLCNPPCAGGEQCSSTGECLQVTATPSPVAPAPPVPPPPTTAPAPRPASPPVQAAAPDPGTVTADAPTARAPSGARVHDGFYFSASLGPGFVASGTTSPPGGPDVSISGGGLALELAFGGTVARGFALGGAIFGASLPSPSYSAMGISANGGGALVSSIGPFADWYFDPTRGLHAQLGFGYAALKAGKGTATSIGSSTITYPSADQGGNGGALLLGFGYDFWVGDELSLGFVARMQYVAGSVKADSDTTSTGVKVLMPSAEMTVTYN